MSETKTDSFSLYVDSELGRHPLINGALLGVLDQNHLVNINQDEKTKILDSSASFNPEDIESKVIGEETKNNSSLDEFSKSFDPVRDSLKQTNVSETSFIPEELKVWVKEIRLTQRMFFFTRNGQTDWDKESLIIGQKEIPLNKKGIKQSHKLAKRLVPYSIKTICHSPLDRARQTAQIIAVEIGAKLIEIEELKEKSSGILEGKPHTTKEAHDEWYKRSLPAGAEPWNDFNTRITKGINKCLQQESPVLIVGHGGTYNSLCQIVERGISDIMNCTLVKFEPPQNSQETWLINSIPH